MDNLTKTEPKLKFKLEHSNTNPNAAYLHTRKLIGAGAGTLIKFDHMGIEGTLPEFMQLLSSVNGLNFGMLTERYTVLIAKSAAYDWDEIIPEIETIIETWDV